MPPARLANATRCASSHEYTVERRAGWLCLTLLDLLFLPLVLWLWLHKLNAEHASLVQLVMGWSAICVAWLWIKDHVVQQDLVMAIARVGVQLSSTTVFNLHLPIIGQLRIPLNSKSSLFIPASTIKDVLVLEGIQGWSVIFYLAILQDSGDSVKLHVALKHTLPRLPILREVRKGTRNMLYGRKVAIPVSATTGMSSTG